MKKIVLFLTLICIGTAVSANSRIEVAQAYCKALSQIAEMAMASRQYDVPAYETSENILEVLTKAGSTVEIKEVTLSIVENAYKRPLIEDKKLRKVLIDSFKDSYFFTCMNAMKDKK